MSAASPAGRVVAISAGRAGLVRSGERTIRTGFVKEPLPGRVWVSTLGIEGDEHVYHDHGGPDMALLVYPAEHYDYWRAMGLVLPSAGAMAENLTVSGWPETEVLVGDEFAIGSTVVQVTQPRSPCSKIAARFGRRDLPVLVQETGFTGYLLRVLMPGDIGVGDEMRLLRRSPHGISVAEAGRIVNVDRNDLEGARRVVAIDALGSSVRRKLLARLASDERLGLDTARLFDAD